MVLSACELPFTLPQATVEEVAESETVAPTEESTEPVETATEAPTEEALPPNRNTEVTEEVSPQRTAGQPVWHIRPNRFPDGSTPDRPGTDPNC